MSQSPDEGTGNDETIDAEVVLPDPTSPAPSGTPTFDAPAFDAPAFDTTPFDTPVTDYTDDGQPTFDYVRDRIEQQVATTQGATELAENTTPAASLDERFAAREQAGRDRLEEIRRAMRKE